MHVKISLFANSLSILICTRWNVNIHCLQVRSVLCQNNICTYLEVELSCVLFLSRMRKTEGEIWRGERH
jgi:hypothetical protein